MCSRISIFVAISVTPILLIAESAGAQIDVSLTANKGTYLLGEPALLRTTVTNGAKRTEMQWGGFALGDGSFDIEVNGDRHHYTHGYYVALHPIDGEMWPDPFVLPGSYAPGEAVQRIDNRVFKIGQYRLRSVLTDRDGTRYESNEVTVEVVPIEGRDSITHLADPGQIEDLGIIANGLHYSDQIAAGLRGVMTLGDYRQLAHRVITECTGSVFQPYAMYGYAIGTDAREVRPLGAPWDPSRDEMAERFLAEHPDSWLVPNMLKNRFFLHANRGEKERAMEMANQLFSVRPRLPDLYFVQRRVEKLQQKEAPE